MIKVILNGCSGRMGKAISDVSANFPDVKIVAGIDKNPLFNTDKFTVFSSIFNCNVDADVILDFSRPDALGDLVSYAKNKHLPLVLCTTGYSKDELEFILESSKEVPLFRSANMSIGVNVLNQILKNISAFLYPNYDIEVIEKHHNQKVDSPSGTALLLANTIKESIPEDTEFIYGREGIAKRDHKEIGLHAVRGGSIIGDHEVIFAGTGEVIELRHTAISRDVFAVGALKACEFMYNRPAGLYSMDDVVNYK